jgi:DNA-binding transcriptional MocR family regulator
VPWVQLPEHVDAVALHDAALRERISIAPGPIFSAKGKFKNFIRLSCGRAWSERMDGAIRTLGRLIGEAE